MSNINKYLLIQSEVFDKSNTIKAVTSCRTPHCLRAKKFGVLQLVAAFPMFDLSNIKSIR